MSIVSHDILETLGKSDKLYCEIQIFEFNKMIKLYIKDNISKSDFPYIEIKYIDINYVLNGNLPSKTNKLLIEKDYQDDKNVLLDNLPCDLKKLCLVNIDEKLFNLPISLEVLELSGTINNELDYLPEGLKTLILYTYNKELSNLPTGLENLFLMNKYCGNLCNLPPGLKFIHLYPSHDILNIELPKNIRYVNFSCNSNNEFMRKFMKLYPKLIYNNYVNKLNIEVYNG